MIASADEPTVKTYTFKTFDSPTNQLQADVHRPSGDAVRPVIVFIHGGALMMGSRQMTPRPDSLLEALLNAGYVVVSIDYRLARRLGRLMLGLAGALLGGMVVHVARLDFGWGPVLVRYEELLFSLVGAVFLIIVVRLIRSSAVKKSANK